MHFLIARLMNGMDIIIIHVQIKSFQTTRSANLLRKERLEMGR